MHELEFFFDYLSPYSYLAWVRAATVLAGVRLRPRPVLLGPLLTHAGQLGPAEIAAKRACTVRDTLRRAARAGVPLRWPQKHPFRSLLAARCTLASGCDPRVISALFHAAWQRGEDLEDRETVIAALVRESLDPALVAQAGAQSQALRANTDEAIARGVFGVPTLVDADGELFFGDDQLESIAAKLAGRDPLDEAHATEVIARPLGPMRAEALRAAQKTAPIEADLSELAPELAAQVHAIWSKTRFIEHLGAQVVRGAPGLIEAALAVRPEHTQQHGFVHAGVQAALADHAAGACAATLAPPNTGVLSIDFTVHLLRPARAGTLFCRARMLRAGRRVSVVESEVFDGADAHAPLASKATVTLALVPDEGAASR